MNSNSQVPNLDTVNILGLNVAAVDFQGAAGHLEELAATDKGVFVSFSNAFNSVMAYFLDEYRNTSNRAALILPDGMPVAWAAKLFGYRGCSRVAGPDLMEEMLRRGPTNGLSHFFYGAGEGVAEMLAEKYTARYPGLKVTGAYSPPFRPLTEEEDAEIVEWINSSGTDILWVGLGSPKMERFMISHLERLHCVQISIGAGLDFLSGNKRRAPKFLQKVGLEWAFRLASEPKRMWRRHVTTNPLFVALVGFQLAFGLEKTFAIRGKIDWLGDRIFKDFKATGR